MNFYKRNLKILLILIFSIFYSTQSFAPVIPGETIGCPEYETCLIDAYLPAGIRYHCVQNTECEDSEGNQCLCCMPDALNDYCTSYNCECEDGYKSDYGSPCTCIPDCTGCTNCTSDTSWLSHLDYPGYEVLITRTCSCNTCAEFPTYRCAAGYFGSPTGWGSGCSDCKTATGTTKSTSAAGSQYITNCYIPSNIAITDSYGSFIFTNMCYYSL